ncbi:MAG: hypothetical protein HFI34_11075 [Lachnospiraceae bacterium]|nr:hypothetical protein [Lachnospiraceae bacterium]
MRRKKRNRYHSSRTLVIILAYANRYFYPLLILIMLSFGKSIGYIPAGISLLAFSAYGLIGYLCKWKHIFCSFQNAYHQKMTPDRIDWGKISKADVYCCSCIWGILGMVLLLLT